MEKALAEREAAKKAAGGTAFGVTSSETSKGAEDFREGFQKLMGEQEKTSKQWEAQARDLAGAAEKIAELKEELRQISKGIERPAKKREWLSEKKSGPALRRPNMPARLS